MTRKAWAFLVSLVAFVIWYRPDVPEDEPERYRRDGLL